MITIKQLASQCGVSIATVSRAMNNLPDVNSDTAERIRRAARQAGYLPSATARTLKTNHSHNLGVIFIDVTKCGLAHEFFALLLESFKNEAEALGYDITFLSNRIGSSRMSYVEHCRYRHCDGVVCCTGFPEAMIEEFSASGIPLITIDYVFDNIGAVMSDNVQGMRELVEYICGMGHRKIAYIYGDEGSAVTPRRLASFHRVMAEHGLEVPENYVLPAKYHNPQYSAQPTRYLLSLPDPPTCIIYPDDFSYLGGMSEIESMCLCIPDDISVAGYDGVHLSRALRPQLTTVVQDTAGMGKAAARQLIEAAENPRTYIPRQVIIPTTLQKGGSVRRIANAD